MRPLGGANPTCRLLWAGSKPAIPGHAAKQEHLPPKIAATLSGVGPPRSRPAPFPSRLQLASHFFKKSRKADVKAFGSHLYRTFSTTGHASIQP